MSLAEIKTLLRSLIVSTPDALNVRQLNKDYHELEGSYIPYAEHGFSSLEAFLRSIPDTLVVCGEGPNATVVATISQKSEHIRDLVRHQKNSKKKLPSKRNGMYNRAHVHSNQYNRNSQTALINNKYVPAHLSHKPAFILPPAYNNPNVYHNNNIIPNNVQMALRLQQQHRLIQAQQWIHQQQLIQKQHQQHLQQLQNLQLLQHRQRQQQQQQLINQRSTQPINQRPPQPINQQQQQQSIQQQPIKQHHQPQVTEQEPKQQPKNYETEIAESFKTLTIDEEHTSKPKDTFVNKACLNSSSFALIKQKETDVAVKAKKTKFDVKKLIMLTSTPQKADINKTTIELDDSNDLHCSADNAQNDEAVPAFAVNNSVIRLDFPEFTVQYGEHIASCLLPTDVKIGDTIHIYIAEVHTPYKFWFHISKEDHELDSLMYQMERVYKTLPQEQLQISKMCIAPGQVCAALYNKNWHRAEILSTIVDNKVKVYFMDYGTVWDVDVQDIKYLLSKFAYLPQQALRGCLSHIKPYGRHWDHKACTKFLSMVFGVLLFAKITEINKQDRILHMILCDNTDEKSPLQINTALIKQHHALLDESWQLKESEQRLHHIREDFPTFNMLEKGEYPTLKDIIQLIQLGIYYERIQDNRLYNSCRLSLNSYAAEIVRELPFELLTTNPFRRIIMLELVTKNND